MRKYIETALKDASVSKVEIERAANRVNITIHTAKPGMVIGKGGTEVENLRKYLSDLTGKRCTHQHHRKSNVQILTLV